MPERPNLMTKEKKEESITALESSIIELKSKRDTLFGKQRELFATLKKQKPDDIREAELRFKALIEEKGKHLNILKGFNKEKKQIKDRISSYDNQKPEKLKKQQVVGNNLPQDEEELEKMVHYWENVLQTKTLKSKEEEDIMKKLSQLESMRASIGDYSNISKEIVNLRKQLQSIKAKVAEENLQLDRIKEGVDQNNKIINAY